MTARITRILVATDFSETSDRALDYAHLLARHFGASVHLLHVLSEAAGPDGTAAQTFLTDAAAQRAAALADARCSLRHRSAGVASQEALFGVPAATIVDYAAQARMDLIVMGTHGRTGVAHLLMGSVAELVVRTASCPVLTVRGVPAADRIPVLVPEAAAALPA